MKTTYCYLTISLIIGLGALDLARAEGCDDIPDRQEWKSTKEECKKQEVAECDTIPKYWDKKRCKEAMLEKHTPCKKTAFNKDAADFDKAMPFLITKRAQNIDDLDSWKEGLDAYVKVPKTTIEDFKNKAEKWRACGWHINKPGVEVDPGALYGEIFNERVPAIIQSRENQLIEMLNSIIESGEFSRVDTHIKHFQKSISPYFAFSEQYADVLGTKQADNVVAAMKRAKELVKKAEEERVKYYKTRTCPVGDYKDKKLEKKILKFAKKEFDGKIKKFTLDSPLSYSEQYQVDDLRKTGYKTVSAKVSSDIAEVASGWACGTMSSTAKKTAQKENLPVCHSAYVTFVRKKQGKKWKEYVRVEDYEPLECGNIK